jgi:peptide chain release factor 1
VKKRDEYVMIMANIEEANEIISDNSDADMTEMAKCNLTRQRKVTGIRRRNQIHVDPKDPETLRM